MNVAQFSTQYSKCCTVQYSTVQYSIVQYNTVQYGIVWYGISTVQYNTVQYYVVLILHIDIHYKKISVWSNNYQMACVDGEPIKEMKQMMKWLPKNVPPLPHPICEC